MTEIQAREIWRVVWNAIKESKGKYSLRLINQAVQEIITIAARET